MKDVNGNEIVSKINPLENAVKGYQGALDTLKKLLGDSGYTPNEGEGDWPFIRGTIQMLAERSVEYDSNNYLDCLNTINAMESMLNDEGFWRQAGIDVPTYVQASLESLLHERKVELAPAGVPAPRLQPMPLNMEMIITDYTYEQLASVGWRDEQMVDAGFAKYIAPTPAPAPASVPKFDCDVLLFDKASGKYGYLTGFDVTDGAAGYLTVCDHEDHTGEHILVDISTLVVVHCVPIPPPQFKPIILDVEGNSIYPSAARDEQPHKFVYTHEVMSHVINGYRQLISNLAPAPAPANIPSPAPLCLNNDERVVAEWLNGAWYYAAQGVGKKITELLNPPVSPAPVSPAHVSPAPFWLDEDRSIGPMWDGARKQWMTPFSNLDLVFSCLKRDSAPVAPESHLLYPMVNGKQDRITSKSVNGEAMFNANEVFKCFGAWEHTDVPVYSALNKLRDVLDAKGLGYIGIIELAIKELSCLKVADKGFDAHLAHYTPGRITGALNNWYYPIEEVDGLIRRLVRQVRKVNRKYAELKVSHKHIVAEDERLFKYLGECGAVANPGEYGSTNAIFFIKQCLSELSDVEVAVDAARTATNMLDSYSNAGVINGLRDRLAHAVECHNQPPGIVVCGDQAVMESLADQWSKVYRTVHNSAGGDVDYAIDAAQSFIEIIR